MLGDLAVGMTVLEKQRTCMRLQGHGGGDFESLQNLDQPVKPEPAPGNLWAEQCGVEVDIARPSPGNSNITAKQGSLKKRKLDRINGTEGDDESKQKTDYIHVRARRGQATDSHSLAERVHCQTYSITISSKEKHHLKAKSLWSFSCYTQPFDLM
ncbi:hypothetical protein SAY86_020860 [Trapa natans]|uniref:Uncharacterized protein n=1 Tax=Trapa natans TaxID=22666 RepID=A0AAN7RL23_TRANT|nr:hypothetical protein SAY86_020860 [Trapa natans]